MLFFIVDARNFRSPSGYRFIEDDAWFRSMDQGSAAGWYHNTGLYLIFYYERKRKYCQYIAEVLNFKTVANSDTKPVSQYRTIFDIPLKPAFGILS